MRGVFLAAGLAALVVSGANPAWAQVTTPQANWVNSWQVAPTSNIAQADFANYTLRQAVFNTIGGNSVRVRITNVYGTVPLHVSNVHIAAAQAADTAKASTDAAFKFGGVDYVVVPPGGVALSDALPYSVAANSEYLLSIYSSQSTGLPTYHAYGSHQIYVAPGNQVSTAVMSGQTASGGVVFVSGLDVQTTNPTDAIVALGDSITDGYGETNGTDTSWPNALSVGLAAAGTPMAVSNAGMLADELLTDFQPNYDQSGLARFERDVTSMPGVTKVILALGINDIGVAGTNATPGLYEVIGGYSQLIIKAHERGLKIYAATITPCGGMSYYYNSVFEAKRKALNNWIKLGFFDGVIDFDAVVKDPSNPSFLLAAYDSGDHIHPNTAGYKAMAAAAQSVVQK